MKDFQDRPYRPPDERNGVAALDLMRAYAARDRAAIVEHLAHLEADQLEYAGACSSPCTTTPARSSTRPDVRAPLPPW